MSGVGDMVSKVQEIVSAIASAPQPEETRFVRNARPFAIYVGIIALSVIGALAVWLKDAITTVAVVGAIAAVLQQFGSQRSKDNQAKISAAVEDKKTIVGAGGV